MRKLRFLGALLASACVCGLQAAPARADAWLVSPTYDTTQSKVTVTLVKNGLGDRANLVLTALAGSKALDTHYRLVDLETGAVHILTAAELELISWPQAGEVVNAVSAAADPAAIVLIVSDFGGMGTSIITIKGGLVTNATVLSAEQRALVGEPPCDKGYAAESSDFGIDCVDIDECTAMLDKCAADATCSNIDGSYKCKCNEGFSGNGKMCAELLDGAVPDPDAGLVEDASVVAMEDGAVPTESDAAVGELPFIAGDGCNCQAAGASPLRGLRALGPVASLLMLAVAWRRRSRRRSK